MACYGQSYAPSNSDGKRRSGIVSLSCCLSSPLQHPKGEYHRVVFVCGRKFPTASPSREASASARHVWIILLDSQQWAPDEVSAIVSRCIRGVFRRIDRANLGPIHLAEGSWIIGSLSAPLRHKISSYLGESTIGAIHGQVEVVQIAGGKIVLLQCITSIIASDNELVASLHKLAVVVRCLLSKPS